MRNDTLSGRRPRGGGRQGNDEINTYARWRINDARIFYKAVRNEDQAKTRLDDLLDGAARTVIAAHDLVEVIRSTQREAAQPVTENSDETQTQLEPFTKGRSALAQEVIESVKGKLNSEFGINCSIFDLKESTTLIWYDRIFQAHDHRAHCCRSEETATAKIKGQQERERKTIQSKAYLQQQQIAVEPTPKSPYTPSYLKRGPRVL